MELLYRLATAIKDWMQLYFQSKFDEAAEMAAVDAVLNEGSGTPIPPQASITTFDDAITQTQTTLN